MKQQLMLERAEIRIDMNFIPAPRNHFVSVTTLACSDRLKQIFPVVPALPLFGEPDEAGRG
jgi:hypothetical protein